MKNGNLLKTTLCAASLAAAGWTALAKPLQRADVPADPAWLAHVDCDGLRPTPVGQFLLGEMEKPEAQAKLAVFQALFSFDLRTQLHGLTLYSTGGAPENGVLLVYAEVDPDRLVTLAKAAKDHQSTDYKKHVIHNWVDDKKHAKNGARPRVYAAIEGGRVIFGQREESVAAALDVLDGARPNLASGKSYPQLGGAKDISFFEGAARKLDLDTADPNAALFRLSRLVVLQIGGTQQQLTATLSLEANDEEVAGNITNIAKGLIALMKMQKEKPETLKVVEALTLKQDGARVIATLSLPGNDVVSMMKADAERKAARKAKEEKAEQEAK